MTVLRHSSTLVALLALALVAGPAASAACPHLGAEDEPASEMPHTGHAAMEEAHPAPEAAAPCHEGEVPDPEPQHAPDAPCVTPCCHVDAPAPPPAVPALTAPVALAAVVLAVADPGAPAATAVPEAVPPDPSPPLTERLHLRLERFLI